MTPLKAYSEVLRRLERRIAGRVEDRPLVREVLESVENCEKPFVFVVKAPTGYGKTSISYSLALFSLHDASMFNSVMHVLPLRAIAEDIVISARELFGEDWFAAAKMMKVENELLEVFHLFPLNVTTVDTFTLDLLKLNTKKLARIRAGKEFGYDFLTQASILSSLIFFDEAHYVLEDPVMRKAFQTALRFLMGNEVPIIVSSATLAKVHVNFFRNLSRQYGYVFKVFEPDRDDPYIRRELAKQFNITLEKSGIVEAALNHIEPEKRNLVVVNSPATAVKVYGALKARKPGVPLLLLHGKMTFSHKETLVRRIKELKKSGDPFILVSTQVVEAGVDVSSDILVTECAPANPLIQRMGRVARYREKKAEIIIVKTEGKPYSKDAVEKTWSWMTENKEVFRPRIPDTYSSLINSVYSTPISMNEWYRNLKAVLDDLSSRSIQVLSVLDRITINEPFLRDYTIPVEVDGDAVLLRPSEVFKLYNAGKVAIEVKGEEHVNLKSKADAVRLARMLVLGKPVRVKYIGAYDAERGLILNE